ncbi:MAG TPA: aldose 1-epimerase family protein [Actinomycetota bacterium]|nr:aldose 1-epimerase family protein [Actinomycetota bacterium]
MTGPAEQSPPPAGRQHEIRHGDQVAVVCEVGATLRRYAAGGEEVLDGFDVADRSTAGRGQILAPWPNRLDGGRYTFEGREGRAALDEPEAGNAIHGLVRWLPWRAVSQDEHAVELACVVPPQPAYPWRVELGVEYRLSGDGLAVSARATNASDAACPFGIGFHPYVRAGEGVVDTATLAVPAGRRLVSDERGLPVGDETVAGTAFDFREPRPIADTKLDTAFTDLAVDTDGRARVEVRGDAGRGVDLWAGPEFGYLMVYTGDTLDPESRRRRGVAIEPMTCPPNALRTGTDLIRLAPGESWQGDWGIQPRGT